MNEISPLFSILIGSKDRPNALIRCIKSVAAQTYSNLEILILDDNSQERLFPKVTQAFGDNRIRCIRSDITLGVAGGRNKLIKEARGDFLITLDDDAVFRCTDSVSKIISLFNSYPETGLLSFKIIDVINGKEVRMRIPYRRIAIRRNPNIVNCPQFVSYFLGGGHAARREVYERCGLYDESFTFGVEELDLSYRIIENGYKLLYAPDIVVDHLPESPDPAAKAKKARQLYMLMRNKIWVNYRYLPWFAFFINTVIWCSLRIASSLGRGGLLQVILGIRDGFGKLRRQKRTPISKKTVAYLKLNNGRLFY